MEHMPPVAVQAFPVDDEADEARDKNTGLGRRERARLDLRGPSPGGRSSLPKQATRLPPFAAQPAQRLPKQSAQGQPGRPLLCGQSPWQGQPPGRGRLSSARPQTHPGSNSRPPAPGLGADGRRARVMCSRRSSRLGGWTTLCDCVGACDLWSVWHMGASAWLRFFAPGEPVGVFATGDGCECERRRACVRTVVGEEQQMFQARCFAVAGESRLRTGGKR